MFAFALVLLASQVPLVFSQSTPRPVTSAGAKALPVQLVVKLTDGSCVIGTTSVISLPLRSEALGTMTILLERVRLLKFSPNHESVIVLFANGDKLQGSFGAISLKLQTIFGPITIPLEKTTEIEVRTGGVKLVEWDVLPFPRNSDWPGPRGEPAIVDAGEIIIRGQPVRTKQTYSAPLTFECEFTVDQPLTHLENAIITFIPEGADPSLGPPVGSLHVILQYEEANSDGGHLYIQRLGGDIISLTKQPFALRAGTPYQLRVAVLSDALRVTLNGQVYEAEGVTLPFKAFHILLEGWKPDKVWHVRNISVR